MANSGASQAKTADPNRREWPRYSAERSFALAASFDGRVVACTVIDVSLGGAKLIFDEEVPEASTIELSHPESEPVICAQVWRSNRELGIEFDFSDDSLGLISVCIRNMVDLEQPAPVPA
ncbi:MAG: PilZ domain-containing protein [Kiloniellaceae bacterium]